jgi:hypothetical protein
MAPDGTDQGSDEKVWDIISPLTHGESDRAAKLRALGNSIIPQLAAEFLLAYRETR